MESIVIYCMIVLIEDIIVPDHTPVIFLVVIISPDNWSLKVSVI